MKCDEKVIYEYSQNYNIGMILDPLILKRQIFLVSAVGWHTHIDDLQVAIRVFQELWKGFSRIDATRAEGLRVTQDDDTEYTRRLFIGILFIAESSRICPDRVRLDK